MNGLLKGAGAGFLLGTVWGVYFRVWMRLQVVVGEFSWSGTLVIIGLGSLAGLGVGLVAAARRAGRRRWWRLATLLAAPLVLFPMGAPFLLPAFLLGGLALSGRPPRWVQAVLALLALGPMALVALLPDPEPLGMPMPIVLVTMATLLAVLALGGAELFRPWTQPVDDRPRSEAPDHVLVS